jgi:hypothetical protein
MTVRTRSANSITVHAGSCDELAALADAYARGEHARPRGCGPDLFRRVAAQLRSGHPVHDLGEIRFYSDRPDGSPYRGPLAPDPDPAWLERQHDLGAIRA